MRVLLGLLVGAAALAPGLAGAQIEQRTQEDLAVDGSVRVRTRDTPRPERIEREAARAEPRPERRADRGERRRERAEAGAAFDRPRRDRDGDGVPDARRGPRFDGDARPDRRRDGDGVRAARPDRVTERPGDQLFPPRRDRQAREDRRADRLDRREDRRNNGPGYRFDRREDRGDRDRAGLGRGAYGGGLVWNRGWRDEGRYDWSRHRRYNRDAYRLPRYYAPGAYGYEYRRFVVGASLSRSFYDQGYWLDDPYLYRLPPAYGPYRWVRYWGDALLVDLRTGRVVDVVHDIFY